MPNKYLITESQLNTLIEKKKKDKRIANEIKSKIDRYENSLNESHIKKSAVNSILETYKRKGLLNKSVLNLLKLDNNK